MCITVEGSWRPCCRFNKFPHVDITNTSFREYKGSDFYQDVITDMENGWADGCKKCQSEEARDQTSLRQVLNRDLSGTTDVEYIELSLSNKCNLACKMCSPAYSTLWNKLIDNNDSLQQYHQTVKSSKIDVPGIFKDVDMSHVKKIKYLGGEPFITPETGELFDYLAANGKMSEIELECNTNCTLFPSKWLAVLDKFKKVTIELSLDGVEEVNDYVRHGKTWNTIDPVIHKWSQHSKNSNVDLNIFSTVQAYNLHDMKNVKALADSIGVKHYSSLLVVPEYLSVHVLPAEYLTEIKDDYNKKYYPSIENNNLLDKFKEFTYNIDNVTGLHIADVIPTLYKHMEK